MDSPQIVCLGGFPQEPMLDYVLGLARGRRVLYVPTAANEDPSSTVGWYERLRGRAELMPLHFYPWPPADLRALTLAHDLVLVPGGNTANMLAIWRVHGLDAILREALQAGVVLSRLSARVVFLFEAGGVES